MKEQKKKNEYINNADFLKALENYTKEKTFALENDLPPPRIPEYVGECFLKIAQGLSHKPNFINYTFKDEMIMDAVENCLMYFENFNPKKSSNPFSYFTTVTWYAFLRRIYKEKKQMYVKCKATEQMGILDENELLEFDEINNKQFELYENISEFIEQFEENRKNKKVAKQKGLDKFFEE